MTTDLDVARELSITLAGTMKTFGAYKRRLPRPHACADHASVPLLYALEAEPLRIGALADLVHSDISTVSRQMTALTAGGLVAKVADPHDRRVQLVALTDEGRGLVASLRDRRGAWMQEILSDWTTEEAEEFSRLLLKFSDSLVAHGEAIETPNQTSTEGKIA